MSANRNKKPIKFIVFDLDGVLADTISSWVFIHDQFGVNNDPAYFAYMNNEIDDLEFMRRDIKLWLNQKNKFHINEIKQFLDTIPLMAGFQDTMDKLTAKGIKSAIVSAGLEELANRVAAMGGINHVYANGLVTLSSEIRARW
jgi:HAD superfamily phosphoserine phosphatase-like hydrolase